MYIIVHCLCVISVRRKHRERAPRPTSPYSTDSNYSAVQVPHRPYPKSERKRQLQEQNSRYGRSNSGSGSGGECFKPRPAVKAKPQIPQHGKRLTGEIMSPIRANTGHSHNAVSMLGQRRRRWANIETALGEFPVFAGILQPRKQRNKDHGGLMLDQCRRRRTNTNIDSTACIY